MATGTKHKKWYSDTVVAMMMMINGDGSDRDGSISSGSSIVVNMLLVDY